MLKKIILKFKKNFIWRIKSLKNLYLIFYFFNNIDKNTYTLVKEDIRFPFVKFGSDFDIYVRDIDKFSNAVKNYYKNKKRYSITLNKKVTGNLQIDLFYNNYFIYKFDIYSSSFLSNNFDKNFIENVISSF